MKRFNEFINEATIIPPNIPNTMNFWHGGNLDRIQDMVKGKSGRMQYGPGLYLTKSYTVAGRYHKGSRKLYLVTVENGTDLNDVFLPVDVVYDFIETFVIKSKRNELKYILNRQIRNNQIPISNFDKLVINLEAIKLSDTKYLQQFYLYNSIDYQLISNAFGFGEMNMLLYNTKKICSTIRINSSDKIEIFDL